MSPRELTCRAALVPSNLPDTDYVVNPYVGCTFGCLYCYASFMGRMVQRPREEWGRYVCVKGNLVEVFARQYERLRTRVPAPTILLSSVTDPYQGAEARYRLTRGVLEVLANDRYPGRISILTKSPCVLRDVDLLGRLPHAEVGLTVTSLDDPLTRRLEARAPPTTERLAALRRLSQLGVQTYACLGPLLPHLRSRPEVLEEMVASVAAAGVRVVYAEHLNLRADVGRRLKSVLCEAPRAVQAVYEEAGLRAVQDELRSTLVGLIRRYGLELRLADVLRHGKPAERGPGNGDTC